MRRIGVDRSIVNRKLIDGLPFARHLARREFEIPDDDPDQSERVGIRDGSIDYLTFEKIMKAQAAWAEEEDASKPIDVGGFTPWHLKYTKYTNYSSRGWKDTYSANLRTPRTRYSSRTRRRP